MLFKSFILRLSQVLALTALIDFILMAATMYLQLNIEQTIVYALCALPFLAWVFIAIFLVRKHDPEIIAEVARYLYPAGGILSIALSFLLALNLQAHLPLNGNQHYVVIFAGIGICIFQVIRCFDIPWMRTLIEVESYGHNRDK